MARGVYFCIAFLHPDLLLFSLYPVFRRRHSRGKKGHKQMIHGLPQKKRLYFWCSLQIFFFLRLLLESSHEIYKIPDIVIAEFTFVFWHFTSSHLGFIEMFSIGLILKISFRKIAGKIL